VLQCISNGGNCFVAKINEEKLQKKGRKKREKGLKGSRKR
jgi:hypothetical protein